MRSPRDLLCMCMFTQPHVPLCLCVHACHEYFRRRKFFAKVSKLEFLQKNFHVCNFALDTYISIGLYTNAKSLRGIFSRMAVYPRNPQKFSPTKISRYTVRIPQSMYTCTHPCASPFIVTCSSSSLLYVMKEASSGAPTYRQCHKVFYMPHTVHFDSLSSSLCNSIESTGGFVHTGVCIVYRIG